MKQRPCCALPHCPLFNELLLNAASLVAHSSPDAIAAIEAVFYVDGASAATEAAARALRAEIARRTDASGERECGGAMPPLLALGLKGGEESPFRVVDG